ncbi:alpha/beta fold hydrolase [Nostocoides sp. F2B08]|uniref:lipase family protein n=1 Tax=Nostocoides sp. F2B08 TaxID=2653936 RepID=UPI0012632438|nr:lipase family protein [Tetrasphaera sp. F2B08]KAB7745719.1 alpha/beta fold hydrolase [Tetrasphaera sp. F2B08]
MNRLPWWLGALLALALIAIGGWLTLRPMASLAALLLLIVVGLLVAGVAELLAPAAERAEEDPRRRRFRLLRGAAYILGAIAVVAFTGLGVRVVIIAVGVSLIVGGILDLLEARASRGVERWNAALGGVASVAFGALALLWPDVSVILIGVFFGIRLILLGGRLLGRSVARARGRDDEGRDTPRTSGRRAWLRLAGNALAVLLAVALVATSFVIRRGAPEPDEFYAAPADVPAEPGRLLKAEPYTREIPEGASAWRILYTTTRDEGQPAVASGLVVVPTDQAGDRIPVIAWAHGTTGAVPGCAPTVTEPFESGAFFNIDAVMENGWAFVATDYVGLGTEGPHPYLIGQGEGRSVLDAIRAARELDDVELGEQTVVWGHSQGGHAALWTGMLAPTYAPELAIEGVAALAPASNLPALIDNLGNVTAGELFAAFVIDSYAAIYDDVSYEEYVRPGAQPIVEEMAGRCLADRRTLISVGTIFALDRTIWNGDPNRGALAQRLEENTPAGPIEAPLLIGQGADDQLVVLPAQEAFVEERCAAGQQVDFRVYEGRDHVPLVEPDSPAIPELVEWTQARLQGEPVENTCG